MKTSFISNILLFLLSVIVFPLASQTNYHFQKFAQNDKLPSNSVVRIYNDVEGYMWFGTKDGLCRYDGYEIKIFRSSALTPRKLPNNEIQCITGDGKHKLWIGTLEGIVIVDKKNFTVSSFSHPLIDRERINSICIDNNGDVWIGTSNNGVLRHNPTKGSTVQYSSNSSAGMKLPQNSVNHIYQDTKGRIWISMWKDGLFYIEPGGNKIFQAPKIGKTNNPFRFFEDNDGEYWVCTWGDGVFNLNFNNNRLSVHPLTLSTKSNIEIDDIVYSIVQDDNDYRLWMVTFNGLAVLTKEADGTVTVEDGRKLFDESSSGLFHDIIKDRRGNLWIGSVGEGLYRLDFNKLPIQNYTFDQLKKNLNVPTYITRICETPDLDLFVTVNRVGVFWFDPSTGEVARPTNNLLRGLNSIVTINYIQHSKEIWLSQEGEDEVYVTRNKGKDLELIKSFSLSNDRSPSENNINVLFEDSKNNIWFGTHGGLYVKPFNKPVKMLGSLPYTVTALHEDKTGHLWVGTAKEGAFRSTTNISNTEISFKNITLAINNYNSFNVQSIKSTPKGEVYIGTREGCLFRFNEIQDMATEISGLYGITEEGIMDILVDDSGILWISTIKRIVRYNPESHASTYFSNSDGILVNLFHKEAALKLRSGKLLFGGNNGVLSFDLSQQTNVDSVDNQRVYITDVLVQNKSIFDYWSKPHYNPQKNRLTLKNSENNLSIEFSALNYVTAGKIQYAYKMSGIDKDWNYVGNTRRFINYANLPSGSYTFMVKANDENGLWNDEITTMNVVIQPPLYFTWWAYLIYLFLLTSIAVFLFRNLSNRIRLRNELKISKIEKDKSEELAQVKLRYFTNISHELLTPLTIIMLQIESMQQKIKGDMVQFDVMRDNVFRLKRLIQQILVFRKTESGNMKLKIQKNDVVAFVNNICQSNFKPLVNEKKIRLAISVEKESYIACFDPDKLDKAVYNVLSNAFKYTPEGGEVNLKMGFIKHNDIEYMRLSVSDSGKGVAEEDLPHIFKRFYISKLSDQSQSHGIGLALTYDLLKLHKGSIKVKSEKGEGSVFTIEIPISENAYTSDEMSEDSEHHEFNEVLNLSDQVTPEEIKIIEEGDDENSNKDFTILVVEDNKELNTLIAENFLNKYHVLTAENGLEALELIQSNEIDLIICDVMMPGMDGLTLCKLVKNDVATSHIHMLMLTAKNTAEDRIDCYNAGADAYIAKPFELKVLLARVKNLISKRVQKAESFKSNQEINISSMDYCSIDEVFLRQAVKTVEDKISDDAFDFDQFAIDMATSKSTLHRKLKSLTGLSPGEFIRNVRLKHAVQMLNNNVGNISEIAFAVGFNDPKYFSRCFKIEFGMTPKEFQEAHRTKKDI